MRKGFFFGQDLCTNNQKSHQILVNAKEKCCWEDY